MKKILFLMLIMISFAQASDNWPLFRGPQQNGISAENDWAATNLIKNAKPLWTANVGDGYSAVAIQSGKLYTMGNSADTDKVYCLDATTGKEIWKYEYASKKGSYPGPRATPTIHKKVCYTLGRNGTVAALNAQDGKLIWKKNIIEEFKLPNTRWGLSGSVVVYKDSLLINAGEHGIALNLKDGSKKWLSKAEAGGYSTILLNKLGAKMQALVFGAKKIYGVDPETGKVVWQYDWKTSYEVNAADPIAFGQNVFIASGYKTGCAVIKVEGDKASRVWQSKEIAPQFSTPIYSKNYIYGSDGNVGKGNFKCINPINGKVKWSKDIGFSSPVMADNKIIALNEKGVVFIFNASPEKFTLLAQKKVIDDKSAKCWTMPVLCDGKLYCRNSKGLLVCLNLK